MDKVLAPYFSAEDEKERQQRLDELLRVHAAPVIRQVLRRRLGFYVSARGVNENNHDAEDLYQEAMTRLVEGLKQLEPWSVIENFGRYVSRIAANACIDFIRAKSPARTRLKYSLRDLLKRHRDFASWEYEGELLCGLVSWRNTQKRSFSNQSNEEIETELDSFKSLYFADEDIRLASLSQIVAELLDWIAGPVEIDALVRMIAHLLEIKDQQVQSFDDPSPMDWDDHLASNTQTSESQVAANELLARLWRALIHLPVEQRDAFVLGFEDDAGQDLFSALLAAEIVGWDELANGMGRSIAEIVQLRTRMPMDIATVAGELRSSRENIYKWRFRAIRRLKTELGR